MKILYYSGCLSQSKTTGLTLPMQAIANSLGIEIIEIPSICCGAFFTKNIIDMYGPVRVFLNARKLGNEVMTTCALCYNVLKQTNSLIRSDPKRRSEISSFFGEDYDGGVKVYHFLEILRDKIGFDKLSDIIKVDLKGLKVAPYYGCLLLRPYEEIRLDNPENPSIFEDFLASIGCEPVDFPYKTECCGSYLGAISLDSVIEHSHAIIRSALTSGAEVIAVACPLCHFNLDQMQERIMQKYEDISNIPILYFTQLLAIALNVEEKLLGLEQHSVNPRPWLRKIARIQHGV
ncbi:MAG: CoB--CoM heterodisulfide reductase iron-sulfur subunit B family protein [Candidatus Bathyarchaeia archaeon]|nr:CoB--CoM heterodisulfide reductase iron-sulfur subunit B family protein [Candidatus Bathyarchaeota archaeon]